MVGDGQAGSFHGCGNLLFDRFHHRNHSFGLIRSQTMGQSVYVSLSRGLALLLVHLVDGKGHKVVEKKAAALKLGEEVVRAIKCFPERVV